jgi:hypothetical protein
MSSQRVDHLLEELTARYDLQDRFLKQVRPLVDRIFSDEVSEERRTILLEVLAQTCQNDLLIRRRFAAIEVALKDLVATIGEMGRKIHRANGGKGAPEAGA